MALREQVRDVLLRDGSVLRLRPPQQDDEQRLLEFFSRLSRRSLHLRFEGLPQIDRALAARFLDPDWEEVGALTGVVRAAGSEQIVALGSWSRLRDRRRAEVAFAVEDRLQGHGIGTRLLEQLAESAAAAGIEEFVAEVLAENAAMLAVFGDAGFELARVRTGELVEVRLGVVPSEAYRERRDLRDHEATVASLRPFFAPASVAVVGASPRPGSIGGLVYRNILVAGFQGDVYPINRDARPLDGRRAYGSVGALPAPVDLTLVCVPAETVLEVVADALTAGCRAFCVLSAGFAEIGAEGEERQSRLLDLVRGYGGRLLGPNCLGLFTAATRLNATFAPRPFPPGPVGFSSQSGALGLALLEETADRGLGFSAFVSVGNKADVSTNDLLEYWEDDPSTELVLLYLESFGNPRKFGRIARRLAGRKPILAMKSGVTRAGARAAGSHTAALAGAESAVAALFHQAGVIRVGTLEELADTAMLLTSRPLPSGPDVAVLTNAGGLGILCADAAEPAGLRLAPLADETQAALRAVLPEAAAVENPVDLLGSATAESYARALPALLADPGVDAVIAIFVPAGEARAADVHQAVSRVVTHGKPVLSVLVAADRPPGTFGYPESAARALGRAAERAAWLARRAGAVPAPEGVDARAAETLVAAALAESGDAWLPPARARDVLEAYGVRLVAERVVASADEAVKAAGELGLPAVVKTAAPGVHKTEVGGVALDLRSEAAVRGAAERIGMPVLVQPFVAEGVELLAGLVQDPVFGPLVGIGPGGTLAELIGEAQFRIAPLTDVDVEEMVLSGKTGRLVRGFRGGPAADVAALADLLHRLSALGDGHPEVAELDLNPVLGLANGYVVVDARVRLTRPREPGRTKTW